MGTLKRIAFVLAVLVISTNAYPEFKATGSKLIKINEHEKSKNILMLKKTQISEGGQNSNEKSSENSQPEGSTEGSSKEGEASKEESDSGPIGTLAHVGGHNHGVSSGGSCVNPPPEPLKIYSNFAKALVSHRMFILASSRHYADQASLVLTGNSFSPENANQACLRVVFEGYRRRLSGYGKSSTLSCEADEVTDISCFRKENRDATLRITYVWSDGRSSVLAIMCGNGQGSWAILSNEREIDDRTTEAILQVVESYGFDPEDIVNYSLSEDDCASGVQRTMQEGPCVENDDQLDTIPEKHKDAALRILQSGVYTPFSSLSNVYATGMFIRGSPLKANEDVDQVCVKDTWNRNGEIEREGFQNQDAFLQCDISDFTQVKCYPNEEKADAGSAGYIYNRDIYPIWTDGRKYVLTYNCLSTNMKTWSLHSTSKQIPNDIKTYILSKVADYGFDPLKGHEANYDNCSN